MLSTRLRLMLMLGRWLSKERGLPPMAVSRLPLRCWLVDCDINRHMNNSRYLALMDMGRWHYLLVSGLASAIWQRRWMPVVVRIDISFQASLKPGTRFELVTRCEEVGNRSITLMQEFRVEDRVTAVARVVASFLEGGKSQTVATLFENNPHLVPDATAETARAGWVNA
jgi:YbgC/YbaW family acyl-CoA thioester hydrolase